MTIEYTMKRTINNISITETIKVITDSDSDINVCAAIKEITKAIDDAHVARISLS